jgi:hypothetical protein
VPPSRIVWNPAMIDGLQGGYSGQRQNLPDGAKMAKIHWNAETNDDAPGQPQVSGDLHDVDVMAKDSKRFAASGGWGYGQVRKGIRRLAARRKTAHRRSVTQSAGSSATPWWRTRTTCSPPTRAAD